MQVYLIWDDEVLTIAPSFKALEKAVLTIEVKSLVQNETQPWKRDIRKHKEKMFEVLQEAPFRVIRTQQGFLDDVVRWCKDNGHQVAITDDRLPFPKPRFDLMSGFRFSQEDLLTKALLQNRSGLIGAPTRYGKSRLILNTIRSLPNVPTVLTMPGVDLIRQSYDFLRGSLFERSVVMMGAGSKVQKQGPDVTVCSVDSLDKCNPTHTRLLLIDEPHAAVTEGRLPLIAAFVNARKIGFGATLDGRFDNRDRMLVGTVGPVLANRTFKEAVDEGAICPITCILYVMPETNVFYSNRDTAYKTLLYQNPKVAAIIDRLGNKVIPPDWQSMFFIKNEKQADYMKKYVGVDGVVAMAKKLGVAERRELFERMANGEVLRCLASDIYAQGVTFSDIRVVVNLAGGGPYTNAIQKPGRLAEVRPGKKCGILVDFVFPFPSSNRNGATALAIDSSKRFKLYQERGYDVVFVKSPEELETAFNALK